MITVRDQQPEDAPAVAEVLRDAFGPERPGHGQAVAELAEALLAGPSRIALVAERDGEVVGHVQLSQSWLDAARALVDVLVLSPLGVSTAEQRSGVGSALMREALRRANAMRAPLVFLEGNPDYYPRFGFRRGRDLGFTPPSPRIPDGAFQVVTLDAYEPWMLGPLVYCDVFWRHDVVGLRRPT